MALLDQLNTLYHQGRLLPFIGSGLSSAVSWQKDGGSHRGPSWDELIEEASRSLGSDPPELLRQRGTDLQLLEYYKLRKQNFSELVYWLRESLSAPDEAIQDSQIHTALAKLHKCKRYYTTNYDDFLERALTLSGRVAKKILFENEMNLDGDATEVVKFHGDFSAPDTMVFSESQYQRRLKLDSTLDHLIRSDMLNRAVLFLGYSFRDPNVAYLFQLHQDQFGDLPDTDNDRRAYILLPDPSDFDTRLFRERNIEVIAISSTSIEEDIATIIEEIAK